MAAARVLVAIAIVVLAGTRMFDETPEALNLSLVSHFTPASRATGRFQYVPFDVPRGTRQLTITYRYDGANGENAIDLGVFGPGSLELGTTAFRGWSGTTRSTVTIGAAGATPGYRPGPIDPGRWHLVLGLLRVRDAGVDVSMRIVTETGLPDEAVRRTPPPAAAGARRPRPRWYVGALHTHTQHSDGSLEPADVLRRFQAKNFDFVAITDHNTTTHASALAGDSAPAAGEDDGEGVLWIAGEEVTTPAGHAAVWGLDAGEWVDFRVGKGDGRIRELVNTAQRYGALFAVNHPFANCDGCRWEHELAAGIDAIEVSNGEPQAVERTLALWDSLLAAGRRITAVGSSDWHGVHQRIDAAHVRVYASARTEQSILSAIRNGRVIVMTDAAAATPDVVVRSGEGAARVGESLRLQGPLTVRIDSRFSSGRVIAVTKGQRHAAIPLDGSGQGLFEIAAASGYVRFEISAADGTLAAITNPVYLSEW